MKVVLRGIGQTTFYPRRSLLPRAAAAPSFVRAIPIHAATGIPPLFFNTPISSFRMSKKSVKRQTSIASFFTKPGSSSEDKTTPSKATDLSTQTRTPNEKENVGTSSDEKELPLKRKIVDNDSTLMKKTKKEEDAVAQVPAGETTDTMLQDSDQESPVKKSIARKKRRRTIQDDDNEELELEQVEKVIILSYEALRNEIGEEDVKVKVKDEVNKGRKKPSKKDNAAEEVEQEVVLATTQPGELKLPDWATSNGDVPYEALVAALDKIDATTKRLEIVEHATQFFKQVIIAAPEKLVECIYLCINQLGPTYSAPELGLGDATLISAIAASTGRTEDGIKRDLANSGDLGSVAQKSKEEAAVKAAMFGFKPKKLYTGRVFQTFKDIANLSGKDTQKAKKGKIIELLKNCQGSEPKYLIRCLAGSLRIGLAEKSIFSAVARASVLTFPSTRKLKGQELTAQLEKATEIFRDLYNQCPNYEMIIPKLLEVGVNALPQYITLTPGIPLKPMLAHPTKAITEVLDRFEGLTFTCEFKYDGERAQIHRLENGACHIFSRNSENLSPKYPDIMDRLPRIAKEGTNSFVLDCEAVAWDRKKKCILPFQVLSTRKRKDVQAEDVSIQVCVFVFDILYLNGEALIKHTFRERRDLIHSHFNEIEGEFAFAIHSELKEVNEIQVFLEDSIKGNCEGLMVKTLDKDSTYEPSKRSRNWLKIKKDYLSGVGDTLDLVVIGAYTGRGKRTGVYGGYLLACYNADTETYQSICKIGTGFSDEDLANHTEFFKPHIVDNQPSFYECSDTPNIKPDVWFKDVQVWEIKCADLSISPVHKAAMGDVDAAKGISLRFPRFIRIRDDKNPEQATDAVQVAQMYRSQQINNQSSKKSGEGVDEDFEY